MDVVDCFWRAVRDARLEPSTDLASTMAPLSEPRLANDTLPATPEISVVEDLAATSLLEAVLVSEDDRLLMSAAVDSLVVAALVNLPSTMMYSD